MGWAVGWDTTTGRFRGYGVPAFCDHPDCGREIDRGLAFACDTHGDGFSGDYGLYCGRFYCSGHPCCDGDELPPLKPEHPGWLWHVLTDGSWSLWREENREQVKAYHQVLVDHYRLCRECGKPLTKRQIRFCSKSCSVSGQNRTRAKARRKAR